ncbi:MAG: chemoreceptor glutamine deamidase CheD [Pseudomonadota bacterium]|nr:chemoreceptor glutamine deamidase CheD [Pseudomonadota bacterium]
MNAVASPLAEAVPATYYDNALQTEAIKLLPADYVVTGEPVALVTLLGSCVAACIYDPAMALGGMNHFMLPDGGQAEGAGGDVSARYGMHAMELLINGLLKRGARRQRLLAKVFGGGNVLSGFYTDPIGTRNARFVLEYLQAERIPILAQDLGDIHPRKVCFFAQTGRALVRRLPSTRDDEIVKVERAYYGTLARAPVSGSVELF